jgi:hypothetical protein
MSNDLRARLRALMAEMRERAAAVPYGQYWDGAEHEVRQWAKQIAALLRVPPEAASSPPDAFDQAVTAVLGPACIACGERDDGGYEVDDGPGPFCASCWERLHEHFAARAAAPEEK